MQEFVFNLTVVIFIILLAVMPTGFPTKDFPNSTRAVARVLEVNNDNVFSTVGFVFEGEQVCKVEILDGPFKGQEAYANNMFTGRLEVDKVFVAGDKALVVIDYTEKKIRHVTMIDHYRIHLEVILFTVFALFLILFARWTGVKTLLSFVLTVLMIWKLLIPMMLKGWNPIIISLIFVITATTLILVLVGGFNRKSAAAVLGSLSGTILTAILAIVFGKIFKIHGAVLPHSETLLYAGYAHLNLTDILIAVVFIASAGALMDLAIDISAALYEVVEKNPHISRAEAIQSGFNVGRAVLGTMITTLLFAYTGGFLALLMVFMAQGTPVINILNLKYVSAEIMHTIVGSFGLVAVAPFTAYIAGTLFTQKSFTKSLVEKQKNCQNLRFPENP
ncbi:MAG: YibE/F family protein [Bacillota bacterium]